jgi:hypothetical protein
MLAWAEVGISVVLRRTLMHIILRASAHNDEVWPSPDYGILELSPVLCARLIQRMDLAQRLTAEDSALSELRYDAGGVVYMAYHEALEDLVDVRSGQPFQEALDAEDYCLVADYDVPDMDEDGEVVPVRVECQMLLVCKDTVTWRCLLRHTDIVVTTASITRELLVQGTVK